MGPEKVRDVRGGYLGIIQRGKDVADMEFITTTEPKLSSRSLAESYKALLSQSSKGYITEATPQCKYSMFLVHSNALMSLVSLKIHCMFPTTLCSPPLQ
jgi:hypothetical protein